MTRYRARHPDSPTFEFATHAALWAYLHGLLGDDWEVC